MMKPRWKKVNFVTEYFESISFAQLVEHPIIKWGENGIKYMYIVS